MVNKLKPGRIEEYKSMHGAGLESQKQWDMCKPCMITIEIRADGEW